MRHHLAVVIMVFSLSSLAFGPAVLTESDFARCRVSPYQSERMAPRKLPQLDAKAALLVDGGSGTTLFAKNEHERLPPASTTKMVTALLAVEGANLGERVAVLPSDLMVGSVMGISVSEEPTLRELLYGLLLVSDNAVAEIVARHVAGSRESFVTGMNSWVAGAGLNDTHFCNPHGLDETGHYSSAHDLAVIGRRLLESPVLSEIVGTREQWAASRLLESTNELLGSYPGATGVKTGTTDAAGQCLVASASRGESWALAVVLGSQDRYGDAQTLLDHYFEGYQQVSLGLEPSSLARVRDSEGVWHPLVTKDTARVLMARWQATYLRSFLRVEVEEVTGTPDEPVGRMWYLLLDRTVAEYPLYLGVY